MIDIVQWVLRRTVQSVSAGMYARANLDYPPSLPCLWVELKNGETICLTSEDKSEIDGWKRELELRMK